MAGRNLVVNIYKDKFDVYIGRKGKGHDGYFGNPFHLNNEGERTEVLELYRKYFYNRLATDPEFKSRILGLKDKILGCFCKPKLCHGDVIVEWLKEQNNV